MVFPDWNEPLAADLAAEADAFLRQVIWNEDGRLATLLTAPFSMLNARLAGFYGVTETVPAGGLRKVAFRPGQRAGIFTLGALQATLAKDNDTDAVARGRFLREVLLCQTLPEPPANLNVVPPPPDGQNNMRERLARHSADPTCAACHDLMDPLGLAFEIYDGIGRHRTTDLGKPIDTAGTLTGAAPGGRAVRRRPRAAGAAGGLARRGGLLRQDRLPLRPRPRARPGRRLRASIACPSVSRPAAVASSTWRWP